nr:hypothetical protein [Micromonospora sp. DSM 115978]
MDLKEHVLRLAAEHGCDLEWQAVTDAAAYDPDEVIETLDEAAKVAARQLVRTVPEEAAADLRSRLTRYDLESGMHQVAEDLARVSAAYRTAGEQLAKSRADFAAIAHRLAGTP